MYSRVIGKPRVNEIFPRIHLNDYYIVRCDKCTFYYINPDIDLSQEEWAELYKDDYFAPKHNTDWQISLANKEREDRIKIIIKYLGSKNGPFLDIGCGEGFMLSKALMKGFRPYGLDIANNIHKSIESTKVHFFEGNIFEANYKDNYFSAIYMDAVLEHVDDPFSYLKEMNRVLKPNGIGFLIVPNEDSLMNDTKKLLYALMLKQSEYGRIKPFVPPYHINGFNNKSLQYAIEITGFKLINILQFAGNYQLWRAHKPFTKAYFKELILFPSGLLSILLRKQAHLQVIFTK
jgi:ubiquinone/menaquinone biosynthesis C-methylase UbiE